VEILDDFATNHDSLGVKAVHLRMKAKGMVLPMSTACEARKLATALYFGDEEESFRYLGDFLDRVELANPGATTHLWLEEERFDEATDELVHAKWMGAFIMLPYAEVRVGLCITLTQY
jgi:hypothetical protein